MGYIFSTNLLNTVFVKCCYLCLCTSIFFMFFSFFQLFIIVANKYFVSSGRIGTLIDRLFVHVGLFWVMDALTVTLPG